MLEFDKMQMQLTRMHNLLHSRQANNHRQPNNNNRQVNKPGLNSNNQVNSSRPFKINRQAYFNGMQDQQQRMQARERTMSQELLRKLLLHRTMPQELRMRPHQLACNKTQVVPSRLHPNRLYKVNRC